MLDRIRLTGIRGMGFHGVLPHERVNGQTFIVDIDAWLDLAPAAASDDLSQTVDYSSLAAGVLTIVEGEPVDLIETLAEHIAQHVLGVSRITKVEVTVHKPQAPVETPLDDVSVTVVRSHG